MDSDRREVQRHRVLRPAQIVLNNSASTIDCTIRNESETGARLALSSTIGVPDEFTLKIKDRPSRHCHVVRRTATEIGVSFIDPAA